MNKAQKSKLQKKNKIILCSDENSGKVAQNNTNPIRVEIKPRHNKHGVTQVMEINIDNERIRKSLDTSCPTEATEKVQPALLEIINQRIEKTTPLIAALFKEYEFNRLATGKQASDDTKRKNVVCMKRILSKYDIDAEKHDIRYFAKKIDGQPIAEHYAQFHRKPTDVRMARSIFSKGWVRYFKERCGIDTSFFSNWIALQLDTIRVKPFMPDERERKLIEEKCEKLRTIDPDLFLAYALAYGLGLRSSEIQRAKFSDLWESDGNKLIRIWNPKGVSDCEIDGRGYQDRPCDPAWWDELMKNKTSDDAFIVPVQEDRIVRDFPQFLRISCGITDKRPVHRLRKYCGHRIMKNNDIFISSKALGHSSIEMTSKIYSGLPSVSPSF
jgi:integrase